MSVIIILIAREILKKKTEASTSPERSWEHVEMSDAGDEWDGTGGWALWKKNLRQKTII